MEVFRISGKKYSKAINASGKANRWNKDNQFVIYTGQSRSLSTLESLVHHHVMPAIPFGMMVISIPGEARFVTKITVNDLPEDWKTINAYSHLQELGSDWYINNKSLVLQVPSVIIPQESNFIINRNHPDFTPGNVALTAVEEYFWDGRLFP